MERPSLQTESVNQRSYITRTPEDYLQRLDPDLLASFDVEQLHAIRSLLAAAIPKPSPKIVDLRFGVDLVISRFYVVLFVGKDRRKQPRFYVSESVSRIGNAIAAVLMLLSLNLLISLFVLIFVYLIKSALGIDLFPQEHLLDQIHKF